VYQFKINFKAAKTGDVWKWHRDFVFWQQEDGMPDCSVTNVAICLDEMHEGNGPLLVALGSHRVTTLAPAGGDPAPHAWTADVSADLRYTCADEDVVRCCQDSIKTIVAPAGRAFLLHPNVIHSSPANLSADLRRIVIITYNSVTNAPSQPTRPEFLVSRDSSPLMPLGKTRLSHHD